MNVVYLAGHYNADCYRARATANLLRRSNWEPLDPMRRDFRGMEADHVQEIVSGDLKDIVDATHVLANFSLDDTGTSMECWYAASIGRPVHVFVDLPEQRIGPWVRYIATTVSVGLDNAIEAMCQ